MSAARRCALALLAVPLLVVAAPEMPGRQWVAPQAQAAPLRVTEAAATYRWDDALPKSTPAGEGPRALVGFVRASPKDFADVGWQAVDGGWAARFDVVSAGAEGLRVRLDLSGADTLDVRVRDDAGRVESMTVPAGAGVAWGPWTEGAVQAVEVFSPVLPARGALRLGAVVHFDQPLDAKAAG
ncbi:MAG TPA: hypothetical protein VFV55_03570, partial [Usitatibacteraceae bacterium]|nr:hypothetical protein [Usitatibacteraceae bacterium]